MLHKIEYQSKQNSLPEYLILKSTTIGILLYMSTLFLLTSCDDLTRLPQDQITTEQYWNSPEDVKVYLNQFYPYFRKQMAFWGPDYLYDDGSSDNMAARTDITVSNDRIGGLYTVNSENNVWSTWYSRIRDVNVAIESSIENEIQNIIGGNQYLGEAYFFRAYFYYQLLRAYGSVPYIDKPLNTDSEELAYPRVARNEIVDLILEDLDYAKTHIPPKKSVSANRLNKETVLQFISRVALFEGTWEKYHMNDPFGADNPDPEKYLSISANASKTLIDMGTAELSSDYSALFNQEDLDDNPEVMLERQYSAALGLSGMMQRRVARHGGGTGLTRSLVNSYLMKDGLPIEISSLYKGDETINDLVTDRDPRLRAIIKVPGQVLHLNSDGSPQIFEKPRLSGGGVIPTSTGFSPYKGANPEQAVPGQGQESPAVPLFRYAEALLNYAEAEAELGTLTQEDVDISINKLRERVGMPPLNISEIAVDPNWKYPDLSPIINEVRRERRVELACESFRFDDILRWAVGDKLLTGYIPRGIKFPQSLYPDMVIGEDINIDDEGYVLPLINRFPNGYGFNPSRDYLLAVPPEELTLNPNLTQNPGW